MKNLINCIFIILLLCCPLIVNAKETDINIKSIELVEKSTETEELNSPLHKDLIIDFNLKFKQLNDNAKYKVIIKNNSNQDYKINENNTSFSEEEFIKYDFMFEEDSNIIKPNTEKTMYITITYFKEVEDNLFVDEIYHSDNHINLSLLTETINNQIKNPQTGIENIIFIISFIVVVALLTTYMVINKKNISIKMIILIALMIVPITVKAIEEIKIEINTHIEIEQTKISNFTLCNALVQFEKGMTFKEWINSDYNGGSRTIYDEDYAVLDGYWAVRDGDTGEIIDFDKPIIENKNYACYNVG